MSDPRNWLCLITSDREIDNIDEMTREVWPHFDGIVAVVHKQGGDSRVADLLNERKKAGVVLDRTFSWHHGHAMNSWLFDPHISLMDACWIRDSSERFNPAFTTKIKGLVSSLLTQNVWNLAQTSKLLMFRRWYGQQFVNGLHWGLSGLYGNTIGIDQITAYKNDRDCAYSVRNERRSADHRYRHEVLYLLDYGPNGNHLALFHQNPRELDAAQWGLFRFTQYLEERGVHGVDQFGEWLKREWAKGEGLPLEVRGWINAERPFRNYLRYYVLEHSNEVILKDEDTWRL